MAEEAEEEKVYFVVQSTVEVLKRTRSTSLGSEIGKLKPALAQLKEGQHFDVPIKTNTDKEVRQWRSFVQAIRKEESPVYDRVQTVSIRNNEKVIVALRIYIPKYE